MKPALLLIFGVLMRLQIASGQTLSPFVVSTSGAFYQNSSGSLSSTVGEMTMVETFAAGGSMLTQGFQQSLDIEVGIHNMVFNSQLSIFPNPTTGSTTLALPSDFPDEFDVHVFDAIGKLVFSKSFNANSALKRIHLSLEDFIDGMYVLEVSTPTRHFFSKINLIK